MSFEAVFKQHQWEDVKESIYLKTATDVEAALNKPKRGLEDFKALISPAAAPYLEQMAQLSQQITQKRFGRSIQLYLPMYLSNECQNICTYCGFSFNNKMPHRTLSDAEILKEVAAIKALGYEHVLLVTGEANQRVGVDYLRNAIQLISPHFANVSMEVQPLDQQEYEMLLPSGLHAVLVYQETYHQEDYRKHHPKGKKSNFFTGSIPPTGLEKQAYIKLAWGFLLVWRTGGPTASLPLSTLITLNEPTGKRSIPFPFPACAPTPED